MFLVTRKPDYWPFDPKINGYPRLIVKYFCVKFDDPSWHFVRRLCRKRILVISGRPDAISVIQSTVSKHWRKLKALIKTMEKPPIHWPRHFFMHHSTLRTLSGQWLICYPEPHCGQHIVAIYMCHEHLEGSETERLPLRPHACGIVYLLTSSFTGRQQHL